MGGGEWGERRQTQWRTKKKTGDRQQDGIRREKGNVGDRRAKS